MTLKGNRKITVYYSWLPPQRGEDSSQVSSGNETTTTVRNLLTLLGRRGLNVTAFICNRGDEVVGMIRTDNEELLYACAVAWLSGVDLELADVPDTFL